MSKSKAPARGGTVEVRVLRDHAGHLCGAVVALPADAVAEAVAEGWADASPEAVAFAKSLPADG